MQVAFLSQPAQAQKLLCPGSAEEGIAPRQALSLDIKTDLLQALCK